MYYCENCKLLFDSDKCSFCRSESLPAAKDGDMCFLTEKGAVYGEVLKDALVRENIPYEAHSVKDGCRASVPGLVVESIRFFVPYAFLTRARETEESVCET